MMNYIIKYFFLVIGIKVMSSVKTIYSYSFLFSSINELTISRVLISVALQS